jgi:(1->4)-alpha-D-glucan 1-alpha-D-glucosylmutase
VGEEIAAFAGRIAPAGALNALSQTALRLTVPGVPDLYQGTDLWDFSMVDPDNRRKVDYTIRRAMLAAPLAPAEAISEWRSGQIKQTLIARLLGLRAQNPALFAQGSYRALRVAGPNADHVVAFARQLGDLAAIVVVPRLVAGLLGVQEAGEPGLPMVPDGVWRGTRILLPRGLAVREWRDALGTARISAGATLPVSIMLQSFPVGCFVAA